MKPSDRLLSVLLISLPLVAVTVTWDKLPAQLPLHFTPEGLPDQFGTRKQWVYELLGNVLVLSIVRVLIARIVNNQPNLPRAQYRMIYLLTAAFCGCTLTLLILQGLYQRPIYADWQPALFFLSASLLQYLIVPPVLPFNPNDPILKNNQLAKRLTVLQHMYILARLVLIRVNILAVLLMIVAERSDRWAIGFGANLLAYLALFIMSVVLKQNPENSG